MVRRIDMVFHGDALPQEVSMSYGKRWCRLGDSNT